MKNLSLVLFIFSMAISSQAAVKNLSDSLAQATNAEKNNLGRLLTDISLAPAVDPQTGKNVHQVASVAPGSVYERTGIKVGDLVVMDEAVSTVGGKLRIKKVTK